MSATSETPIRILLVEDNPAEAEYLEEVLRGARRFVGEVSHADTLKRAFERAATQPVDVLLLDLSLPDSAGLPTLQQVTERLPSLPVVVLTGNDDEEVAVQALQHGAQDYLVKGRADGDVLVRAIRYAIERKAAEEVSRRLAREQAERAAAELARAETTRLNKALEETNKAVLALYAELDERAESLKRASELKTQFLSHMSHEFRTPLKSILGLAGLLRDEVDGPLSAEQQKQVSLIQASAANLEQMVDDLLDLAKIEAGKSSIHVAPFDVRDLFAGLKGMIRPLLVRPAVELVFDGADGIPPLETDEAKLCQILRNFITNALKFTERGSVRISVRPDGGDRVVFAVTDTGIGIAPEDHERVFEEFTQLEGPLQRRVKGTGLGLPLCRKLAALIGGKIELESALGQGSTFRLVVPARYTRPAAPEPGLVRAAKLDPTRQPLLVVEDDVDTLFLYERHLRGSGFQVLPATNLDEARRVLRQITPVGIVLDVMLERESSWDFLAELKRDQATKDLPVIVISVMDGRQHAFALGADEFCSKPVERSWLLGRLQALSLKRPVKKVLVVDDEEVARYILKGFLAGLPYEVIEATGGKQGIAMAKEQRPDVVFLDIVMPDLTAFEVLSELKSDPHTADIPVVINTSKRLDQEERLRLAKSTVAILEKGAPSRQVAVARIQEALRRAGLANHGGSS